MLYQKKNNQLEPLTGSTLYAETPIGTVIASFLAVAPSGYIKADGTVYTKAQYPELYERIPDVFKDTTNETFTIDLREVALKGIGLSSLTSNHYSNTGLTLGEFIEDRNKSHSHNISSVEFGEVDGTYSDRDNSYVFRGAKYTGSLWWKTPSGGVTTSSGGATNEVKSVGVNYFVKAKHVALPIDIMDAISEEYVSNDEYYGYTITSGTVSSSSTTLTEKINFTATKNGTLYLTITSGSANIAACQISIDGNIVNYDLTGTFPYKKGMTISVSMRQTGSATTTYKYTRIE